MKIEHIEIPGRNDGAGQLQITAESPEEVMELLRYTRGIGGPKSPDEIMEWAEHVKAGSHVWTSKENAKRPYFIIESSLDFEYTAPYKDQLFKMTGWHETLPDMELTHLCPRLRHTHETLECELVCEHYSFVVAMASEDWNGMTASEYAWKSAFDYVKEQIGFRPSSGPEYISGDRGRIHHNPNYLKRLHPKPGLGCEWLWNAIWAWWAENAATAAQKQIMSEHKNWVDLGKSGTKDYAWQLRASGADTLHLVNYQGITLCYDPHKQVSWEEFAKL